MKADYLAGIKNNKIQHYYIKIISGFSRHRVVWTLELPESSGSEIWVRVWRLGIGAGAALLGGTRSRMEKPVRSISVAGDDNNDDNNINFEI